MLRAPQIPGNNHRKNNWHDTSTTYCTHPGTHPVCMNVSVRVLRHEIYQSTCMNYVHVMYHLGTCAPVPW